MLRFDGNHFGKMGDRCADAGRGEEILRNNTKATKGVLPRAGPRHRPRRGGRTTPPKLRLEIVVYGGDEVTFITPAWLGWKALKVFYEQAARRAASDL